jgi:hypothetical protein
MTTASERTHLLSLLFQGGTTLMNLKCFHSESPSATSEQICAELRSAIRQRNNGLADVSSRFNDIAPKIDVRAWVASVQH